MPKRSPELEVLLRSNIPREVLARELTRRGINVPALSAVRDDTDIVNAIEEAVMDDAGNLCYWSDDGGAFFWFRESRGRTLREAVLKHLDADSEA